MSKAETARPDHIGSHAGNGGQFDPLAPDMRETIARIICADAGLDPDSKYGWPYYTSAADAIIAALPHGELGREATTGKFPVVLIEALRDITASIECSAGVDDGADEGQIYSDILSAHGTAMVSAWCRARSALAKFEKGA